MIQDILPRYQIIADGSTTAFTVPFDIIDQQYLNVYLGSTKQTTGYSVSGKTIIFSTAPEANTRVTIVRVIPVSWENDNYGVISKDSISEICSFLVAKMQTLEEGISRAIKSNIYDDSAGEDTEEFLSLLQQALDTLAQAQVVATQVIASGNTAITNINTAKNSAISDFNSNATTKTSDYNTNAATKEGELTVLKNAAEASATAAAGSATTASGYKDLAKDWANKTNGTVADNEYSAKYYAQQASTNLSSKQDKLTSNNAGTGISITETGGVVKINNTQNSATWGNVTGTLSNQTDLQTALDGKQATLTFDNTPTSGSNNPVTSGGVYTALQNIEVVPAVSAQTIGKFLTNDGTDMSWGAETEVIFRNWSSQ